MKHIFFSALIALSFGTVTPVAAEMSDTTSEDVIRFVESNLLATFYHELGHALIDIERLPVFGQEEDAADVLSVVLIDAFFEEDAAVQITYDAAFGFLGEVETLEAQGEEPAFWDVHGPDLQRFYTLVCLFYGAAPDERDDVAEELGLPEERAESCAEEFELAADSWGGVLDSLVSEAGGVSMVLGEIDRSTPAARVTADLVEAEVAAFNADFELSAPLTVNVVACDEPNAFYDPAETSLTMCIEYGDFLANLAPEL